jgi:hypothetical protein
MCRRNKERENNMQYAGTNYRNKIMELVDEGLLTEREALLECVCFLSMDDNRRVYESLLALAGVDAEDFEEEPIIPMGAA